MPSVRPGQGCAGVQQDTSGKAQSANQLRGAGDEGLQRRGVSQSGFAWPAMPVASL